MTNVIAEMWDWNHNTSIKALHSSNAEVRAIWLTIKEKEKEATAQLTLEDCTLLISILEKAKQEMMEG